MIVKPYSPYSGSKRALLSSILPFFGNRKTLVDLFCGTGSVSANCFHTEVIMVDSDQNIIDAINFMLADIIEFWLTLEESAKTEYYSLRTAFDSAKRGARKSAYFVALQHRGYCSRVRYNKQGGFNIPKGMKDLNVESVCLFAETLFTKRVIALCSDFRNVEIPSNAEVYADPPYFLAPNPYGAWGVDDFKDLLSMLEGAKSPFVLSEALIYRGDFNHVLNIWAGKNGFDVWVQERTYSKWASSTKSAKSSTVMECLVTNIPAKTVKGFVRY